MVPIHGHATVAEIVLEHPECARILRAMRVDFCCRGDVSLAEMCAERGLDEEVVVSDLERAIRERTRNGDDPRTLSTPDLVARIIASHHEYARRTLPFVEHLAMKVARVHGNTDPKLPQLANAVTALGTMLETHLEDEEQSLFPVLLADDAGERLEAIAAELSVMHEDHLRVADELGRVRCLASDFVVPDWACASYRTLLNELEALETDTFNHVHMENHVLMPRFARTSS